MASVADGDTAAACASLSTAPAQVQRAAACNTPDCPSAVLAWHARVTRPDDYGVSVQLTGVTTTVSLDRETATVTGCDLTWDSPITGGQPAPGPTSPGRLHLHRVLEQGYEITDYRPC